MRSKKGSLHKHAGSPNWFFRRYSGVKKREFRVSTGLPATDKNRAKAYDIGLTKFDEWLGTHLPSGRQILIKDIAVTVLRSKENKKHGKDGAQYRSAKYQIETKIIPSFGHYKPNQVTSLLWDEYDTEERMPRIGDNGETVPGRKALRNTRAFMIEILRKAKSSGLIKEVPILANNDPAPEPPKYLERQVVRLILKEMSAPIQKKRKQKYVSERPFSQTKYLFFLMWKQGCRPEEALQYEWSMFRWNEGKHGMLHIPLAITKNSHKKKRGRVIPVNSRVARVFKILQKSSKSKWVFPSPYIKGERQRNYAKSWEAAVDKLGVDATPYNLRDTFITNQLKAGISSTFIGKYCDNSAHIIDAKYAVPEQSVMERIAG